MKNLKRFATVAVAAIAFQLVAVAPAWAIDTCSVSGGVLYVSNDGGYLQMYNDDYDDFASIYCSSDNDYVLRDSITSGKIVVVPDILNPGQELLVYLDNGDVSGAVADWAGLRMEITLGPDDDLEFYGDSIENIANPLISSNKLKITVGDGKFSIQPSNLSGTYTVARPETSDLDIYGGNDNDVIDVRGAMEFWDDQIDIDGEDGTDVVYGSDNEDDIDAEVIYPGLASRGNDGYDYLEGSDKCGGYICLLSFKGITADLEVEQNYIYASGTGSQWYINAVPYVSYFYTTLVLGSGDDVMVVGLIPEFKKVLGGPGDDLLLGFGGYDANFDGDFTDAGEYDSSDGYVDRLYGGTGDDVLKGFAGDDILVGGKGEDRLVGGFDYDICRTGEMFSSCEFVN